MSAPLSDWLAQRMVHVLATDTPVLPSGWAMQIGQHLGWGVVLAWLGVLAVARWWPAGSLGVQRPWAVALLLALWAWVPGPASPAYWLALVFQTPSPVTVVLCAGWLWERRGHPFLAVPVPTLRAGAGRSTLALAAMGVLAGWALLLDSFALLPVQLYAWGFSAAALGAIGLLVCLPWIVDNRASPAGVGLWAVPLALLVFVVFRVPTGNVWDAVLDPCLWLVLQVHLVRSAMGRSQPP